MNVFEWLLAGQVAAAVGYFPIAMIVLALKVANEERTKFKEKR